MKVKETEDRFGKACMIFPKGATVPEIHDWLNQHYQGYQFAIVLDESKDEHLELNEVCVNFFGDLADEAIESNGDMFAITRWEQMRISQYLREHGTNWAEVTRR